LTGLEAAQVWWENLASIVATGKNMDIETDEKSPNYGKPKLPYTNPGMIMFLMKQRFADYRRDKQSFDDEREATGSARPTLEPQELDNEIERRLEKRRLLRENGATGTVKRGRPFGSKTKLD
jgi:hypothetical protein